MDTFKIIILKILITCSVCISAFVFVYKNGFCLADPVLSESALEVLQGGQNSGLGAMNYYGLNAQGYDPYSLFIIGAGGHMLTDASQRLEQSTGYSLDDMGFMVNDMVETASWNEGTADGMINRLTKGAYQSLGSAVQNGVNFLASKVMVGGMAAKMFLTGAIDSATNTISSVFGNNAYIKLTDEFIDNMHNIGQALVSDGDIADLSTVTSAVYGSRFSLNFNFDNGFTQHSYTYVLNFNKDVILYNNQNNGQINVCYKGTSPTLTGVIIEDGNAYQISSIRFFNGGSFRNNGIEYIYQPIGANTVQGYYYDIFGNGIMGGDRDACIAILNALNGDYRYLYSNSTNMQTLFDLLKNKWVTTDDLAQINTKLNELTRGNIDIDGNNLAVIDTDTLNDKYMELYNLIQTILQNNSFLNNDTNFDTENSELTDPIPEPDPEPVENINQGIDIPTGFDNSLLNPFVDIIKTPFKFFTIFSPVFAIFGSNPLLSLWLFFPSFLIIMIIIWCLK